MNETVLTEMNYPIGIIKLNKPDRHNAFDDNIITELTQALRHMQDDEAVRVVVLSSTGKSFCAGGDLNWMRTAASYSYEDNYNDAMSLARLLQTLDSLSKPTIARVQGPAYGGGIGLVAACDIAIGVYDATFALSEIRLGIIPAVIGPYVIRAIGERKAQRYMLTGERFSAAEAYRMGLLHELVATDAALDTAIGDISDALLAGAPTAHTACKDLIRTVSHQNIDNNLLHETARRIAQSRASEEGREGISAFLEKRVPSWVSAIK